MDMQKLYVATHPDEGDWYVFDGSEERENYRLARPYAGPFAHEADALLYLEDKPNLISHRFVEILRQWLSADEWNEMAQRNAAEPEGSNICHSHDFCDANEAMAEAFKEVIGREAYSADEFFDADTDTFNAAWELAMPRLRARIVYMRKDR